MSSKGKIIAGMSGGVDSAVAAYILKSEGYEVIGVTLKTWNTDEYNRCCETKEAESTARLIGIPYYVFNCEEAFRKKVTEPFIESYLSGVTPNPCVVCNSELKWERMLYHARVFGAERVATGHYAGIERMENGRFAVRSALHMEKDQSYMLYRLTQEELRATVFPLSELSKDEVRSIASEIGMSVANRPDSQEICFAPDKDYAGYIERNSERPVPGEGFFVDEEGNVLGKHRGIIHYTVGQRRGLGLPLGFPAYVKEIRPEENTVVIGSNESLFKREVIIGDLSFMGMEPLNPGEEIRCLAKVRYRHKASEALAQRVDEEKVRILFDEPVRAAAPGQSAVLYDEEMRVLGGGKILR